MALLDKWRLILRFVTCVFSKRRKSSTLTPSPKPQDLLLLFGIPYVDAPQEAEAECAELLNRHLVDGIVTDDSDVFLFGGSRIYRNMFNDNKYVECYLLADLERELGLDRDKLVRLAYLLGGDYADGLMGVGPVLGRELLEEFQGPDGLQDFKVWWSKVQSGKDDEDEDTNTAWRRKFVRNVITQRRVLKTNSRTFYCFQKRGHKNLFIEDNWPNPIIVSLNLCVHLRTLPRNSPAHFLSVGESLLSTSGQCGRRTF